MVLRSQFDRSHAMRAQSSSRASHVYRHRRRMPVEIQASGSEPTRRAESAAQSDTCLTEDARIPQTV